MLIDREDNRPSSNSLKVRSHPIKGFFVEGMKEEWINNQNQLLALINKANLNRSTARYSTCLEKI